MNTPILHIGLHKTGTTWFQKRFYPYVKNAVYIDRQVVREKILQPDIFQFNLEGTQRFFSASERVIICEENLTTGIRGNLFVQDGLFKRLKEIFPEAIVVLFLRNQPDKIASTYCYYIKNNGGTFRFKQFIDYTHNNPYNNFNFKPQNLLYHNLLELLYRCFNKEKVRVFFYEDFSMNNRAFLRKYCSSLELEINLDTISFQRENERIRKRLIPLARFLNLFTRPSIHHRNTLVPVPGWTRVNRRILNGLNKYKLFGDPPSAIEIMGKENYDNFFSYYKDSNRILLEKYGLHGVEEYGYPL